MGATVGHAGHEPQPRFGPGTSDARRNTIGSAAMGCAGAGDATPGGRNTPPAHGVAGSGRRTLGEPETAPGRDWCRPDCDRRSGCAVFKDMTEHICGKPRPGLLDVPGVTPAQVGSFYDAAAFFFRQAPWKKLGDEAAIKVECDKFQSGPWYTVVMGQSGLTTGLALYEDLKALRNIWTTDGNESAREGVATTVTFGEEWTIPVADLEAAKKHGWPVARPDAYPEIFHKERGLSLRPPLAWQLELVEGCLRAIPEFVNRHTQD